MNGLNIQPKAVYADLTYGGGSYSDAILKGLAEEGRLFAFDQDADVQVKHESDARFVFVRGNYRYLRNYLDYYEVDALDGIVADLGVSSWQFDMPGRGFSFEGSERLDMRMNQDAEKTASHVLKEYTQEDLREIFRNYGELRNASSVARLIVQARESKDVARSDVLNEVLRPVLPPRKERSVLARVYQALRIEVNEELDALRDMLLQTADVLRPGGRLVVLSYHSLEDRLVKNMMKTGNLEGRLGKDFYGNPQKPFEFPGKALYEASEEEVAQNPRARSARLRIAKRSA